MSLTYFFMFANTFLHVMSHHDVMSTLIAIQYDSLYVNCRFLKTGLVDYIGVLQTPMKCLWSHHFQNQFTPPVQLISAGSKREKSTTIETVINDRNLPVLKSSVA